MFTYNDIFVGCKKALASLRDAGAILADLKKNMDDANINHDKIASAIEDIGLACYNLDSQMANSMSDIRSVCEM